MNATVTAPVRSDGLLQRLQDLQERTAAVTQPLVLLVLRLVVGYALARTGWGKLTHIDATASFFASLGIPAPGLQAVLVGFFELAGGIALAIGLGSRLAAVILIGVLGVALMTAHQAEVAALFTNPGAFLGAAPTPYLLTILIIAAFGAGRFSLDHRLARQGCKPTGSGRGEVGGYGLG